MQPRVILISQWPGVKNGEYELIEKIRRFSGKATVVDYFGVDVDSGRNLNTANLVDEYDFAVSFHYETPKLLNLPTYLWVANPLEFMYLSGGYEPTILSQLRAYDGYLYNGSDFLKAHIARVIGPDWRDDGLEMFPSCALQDLKAPDLAAARGPEAEKLFYCGVNWERGIDKAGRAHNLLNELQDRELAHFFGPRKLADINPWEGFVSYKGEIPFDGVSMSAQMRRYGAVLALSSPAHLRSRTSSSRVFEAFAAGVPVISDHNPHVEALFGDLVYYFSGGSDAAKADSIAAALKAIRAAPAEAERRVVAAQTLLAERLCFEPCFEKAAAFARAQRQPKVSAPAVSLDLFVFHHEQDPEAKDATRAFDNLPEIAAAAAVAAERRNARVRIVVCSETKPAGLAELARPGVEVEALTPAELGAPDWDGLRLGAKVALLAPRARGDLTAFLTQFDFPHHDYAVDAIDGLSAAPSGRLGGFHVAGFYAADLKPAAERLALDKIPRHNRSNEMYRWSMNSPYDHQLGALVFGRGALGLISEARISLFDAVLPVALFVHAAIDGTPFTRSRHLTLRVAHGAFARHYQAFKREATRGFWRQHYVTVTNYIHENNALYDFAHVSREAVAIADAVTGRAHPVANPFGPEELRALNKVIRRGKKRSQRWERLRELLGLRRKKPKAGAA